MNGFNFAYDVRAFYIQTLYAILTNLNFCPSVSMRHYKINAYRRSLQKRAPKSTKIVKMDYFGDLEFFGSTEHGFVTHVAQT